MWAATGCPLSGLAVHDDRWTALSTLPRRTQQLRCSDSSDTDSGNDDKHYSHSSGQASRKSSVKRVEVRWSAANGAVEGCRPKPGEPRAV